MQFTSKLPNGRARQKITRSWQDRDWNRDRRNWCRLPVPLGKTCWIIAKNETDPLNVHWEVVETVLIGLFKWAGAVVYFVGDDEAVPVSPHTIFDSPIVAAAEAEWRNRT